MARPSTPPPVLMTMAEAYVARDRVAPLPGVCGAEVRSNRDEAEDPWLRDQPGYHVYVATVRGMVTLPTVATVATYARDRARAGREARIRADSLNVVGGGAR